MSIKEGIKARIDEFKLNSKDMTFPQKLAYFWDYYKFPVVVTLVIVIGIIVLIASILKNSYNRVFYVHVYNSPLALSEVVGDDFGTYIGIDNKKDRVSVSIDTLGTDISDDYYSTTLDKLTMSITTKEVDVVIASEEASKIFLSLNCASDLRDVLPEELLKKLEGKMFYATRVVYDDNDNPVTETYPCGIYIHETQFATDASLYTKKPIMIFVISNSERQDKAIQYINYIFGF
ncbi:MAG: hypothetical protein IKL73_01095 [Lachnospiraceae bacterium]|nr:hypothetical protein [Lachnospira sp.]MBR6696847.1 hypothetical protein [Lachnospiraceae bacterium]